MNLVFDRLRAPLRGLACAALLLSTAHAQAQTVSDIKDLSTLMFFNGVQPSANVVIGEDFSVYGPSTPGGGAPGGLFYKLKRDASAVRTTYQYGLTYDANLNRVYLGSSPSGQLLLGSDGYFYGVTQSTTPFGGSGTIFRMGQDGGGYTRLYEFEPLVREPPYDYLVNDTGAFPSASLIEGLEEIDGVQVPHLYGTTFQGGRPAGTGVVFKIRRDGSNFAVIHEFAELARDSTDPTKSAKNPDGRDINPNGINPNKRLLLVNGRLYGVTTSGGVNGTGVLFSVSTNPSSPGFQHVNFDASPPTISDPPTNLENPDPTDPNYGYNKRKLNYTGSYPASSLVQIGDEVYGTTSTHGAYPDGSTEPQYSSNAGYGTMFSIDTTDPTPDINVVFNFTGSVNNSLYPGSDAAGDLIVVDGTDIVGTTQFGGILVDIDDNSTTDDTPGVGVVYRYNTDTDVYTQVYVFGADTASTGSSPTFGVVAIPEGDDYAYFGATQFGGVWGYGTAFKVGDRVENPPQGAPQPWDDGGGSMGKWLIAALLLLAAIQLIALRHRRLRLKRAQARQL